MTMNDDSSNGIQARAQRALARGRVQFRAGTKVGRTLYHGDDLIGMMDTPILAKTVVADREDVPALAEEVLRLTSDEMEARIADELIALFERRRTGLSAEEVAAIVMTLLRSGSLK